MYSRTRQIVVPRFIPLGLPRKKWVRLKYVDNITINPGAAAIGAHFFRANSLFDPDLTGVGHQPLNFDQLQLGYDHYTVYGSKITATFTNNVATAIIPGLYGIFLDDNTTLTYAQGAEVIEGNQRQSRWKTTTGIENSDRSVSIGFSAKKFFGVSSLAPSEYRSLSGANPTEGAAFVVWYSNIGGGDPGVGNFLVEIEYLALMTEKRHVVQS